MSLGSNRVTIDLPTRLRKARAQIAIFEKREEEIANLINDPLCSDALFRQAVSDIIGSPYGDPQD